MQVSKRKISWGPTKFEDKKVCLTNFYYSLSFAKLLISSIILRKMLGVQLPLQPPHNEGAHNYCNQVGPQHVRGL